MEKKGGLNPNLLYSSGTPALKRLFTVIDKAAKVTVANAHSLEKDSTTGTPFFEVRGTHSVARF